MASLVKRLFSFDRALLVSVIALAWPTVLQELLTTMVQYADTAMVGQLGATASASVGLTASVTWLVNGPLGATGVGILSCIARSLGAGNRERASRAAQQAVFLAIIVGLLMGGLSVGCSWALPGWLGADEGIRALAGDYFRIICLPMPFRASAIIFGSVLCAFGNTKTPMLVNLFMNLCNLFGNTLLIGGSWTLTLGSLSIPIWGAGLGVQGAAIATALSYVIGGCLMAFCAFRSEGFRLAGRVRPDRHMMWLCVRTGLPIAAERATTCLGQVVFSSLVARLGTLATATHSIAITAEQIFYISGYGMQTAAATLAGRALGAGDREKLRQTTRTMAMLAFFIMLISGAILFSFPEGMMRLFTPDEAVVAGGTVILRMVACSEPLFGIAIVMEGIYNGMGATRVTFLVSCLCMWGVRILFATLLTQVFSLGLIGIWACMMADNSVRCFLLLILFARKYGRRHDKAASLPAE